MESTSLAAKIETIRFLKATAAKAQIETLCAQAIRRRFASVCVNPCHVHQAAELLQGAGVKVCAVIGFPLGVNARAVKAFETKDTVVNGARKWIL